MARGRAAGEARDRQIETAPEEMDGAGLAEIAGAEQLEEAIHLDERAPEAMCGLGVIGGVDLVLRETDRVREFVRHFVDFHDNAQAAQEFHHRMVKPGNGLWLERDAAFLALAGAGGEAMEDEVELDLEDFGADRNGRGAEPARGDIERHLPAMVEPGG